MIRDRLLPRLRRLLGRLRSRGESTRSAPVEDREAPPQADDDAPWYLEGQDETWGWENTNARSDED